MDTPSLHLRNRTRLPEPKMGVRCSKIRRNAAEALAMPRDEEVSDYILAPPLTKEQKERAVWVAGEGLGKIE